MISTNHEIFDYYSFTQPQITFVGQSEHIIYKLTDNGKHFILRIHKPVTGFSLHIHQRHKKPNEYIEGEMALLQHFSKNSSMNVQTPIPNIKGELVTYLKDHTPVTVLTWLDGTPLTDIEVSNKHAYDLGVLIATFEQTIPPKHILPIYHYNQELIQVMSTELKLAQRKQHITIHQLSVLTNVLMIVKTEMNRLDQAKDKTIIHADLGLGNLIQSNNQLSPIDFSFCGYGYPEMDLGFACSNFKETSLRNEVIKGYETTLDKQVNLHAVNTFFAFGVVLYITTQHNRMYLEHSFSANMKRWEETIFQPLMKMAT